MTTETPTHMLYAILCYHDEDFVGSWTKEQDAEVMQKLAVVQEKLTKEGRLGPVARLLPTTAATTLRKDDPPLVLDGPFAETKEQLLGFYVVDFETLSKGYGDRLLIDDLTFKLPPGGIVGVIGPNGAGKTTLFRMITGGETPDEGTFRVGDSR